MNHDLREILSFTIETATRAGAEAARMRSAPGLEIKFKVGIDLVTSADLAAEKMIIEAIRARYPGHKILSEESFPSLDDRGQLQGPLWIIDPIDGTTNFARNHHQVAVSVAFADQGEV